MSGRSAENMQNNVATKKKIFVGCEAIMMMMLMMTMMMARAWQAVVITNSSLLNRSWRLKLVPELEAHVHAWFAWMKMTDREIVALKNNDNFFLFLRSSCSSCSWPSPVVTSSV